MGPDFETQIAINITLQIILGLLLAGAVILVKRRRFNLHCMATRVAFIAQILTILAIMLPAMSFYKNAPDLLFRSEILMHHITGLGAVILWIYINMVYMKRLKRLSRLSLKRSMQLAAGMWGASMLLGLHIYIKLYS
jgi:hypothetical protein